MSEEDKKILLEMKDNCLNASAYNDENRLLKANAITNVLEEIERLRKTVDFLTDEYNKKKAARNYVIANAELFDDFICTGNNFEMSDLLEIFDIGDKKC